MRGYRDDVPAERDYYDYYGGAPYDDTLYDEGEYGPRAYGPVRAGLIVRAGRVLAGAATGAVIVLALVVCVAQYLAGGRGFPGPGTEAVAAHMFGAAVAVVAQVSADRLRGPRSILAAFVVFFTASILLFTQWWN
ncbi:hypothetical protein [Rhodococcus chondri]|uniref:Uncharacterized protein n=1 Tax=Rhodococcus chondri TaxID=3065941 RepID=A0ABU7JXR8_9NOCA|nr:hypothetical protein [Rhodococcus sp. CC-R104]MEE2034319.1 hypothetical protein [Rhodococcus sp. CC-R104]